MEYDQDQYQPPPSSHGCGGCLGFIIGGIVGAIASLILTPVYYGLTEPSVLEDAQFGMFYLIALPLGIVIGGIIGCIIGISIRR